jgi:hypothetical protein
MNYESNVSMLERLQNEFSFRIWKVLNFIFKFISSRNKKTKKNETTQFLSYYYKAYNFTSFPSSSQLLLLHHQVHYFYNVERYDGYETNFKIHPNEMITISVSTLLNSEFSEYNAN